MTRPHLEVANVIRQYGTHTHYLARYGAVTSPAQRRVLPGHCPVPHRRPRRAQTPV